MLRSVFVAVAVCALMVSATSQAFASEAPSERFFATLSALCGKSFAGQVVSDDPVDDAFRKAKLTMKVASCTESEIRIPFVVGEDRSRTWVITKLDTGRLRLKHDHRHADGTEDVLSQYGGDTATEGTAQVQTFPVDSYSIDLFTRTGRAVSNTNVWTLEVREGEYIYQLSRENRLFRVRFDLNTPL